MHTHSHRHFVALPLAGLLLLLVAGVNAGLPVHGAALPGQIVPIAHEARQIDAGDTRSEFAVGRQIRGLLEPHAGISVQDPQRVTVERGEALFVIPAFAEISLGQSVFVHALATTLWVQRTGSVVSLASLSDPVLIRQADALTVLPPGLLLRISDGQTRTTPLPTDWLRQHAIHSEALSSASTVDALQIDGGAADDPSSFLAQVFLETGDVSQEQAQSALHLSSTLDPSGRLAGLLAYRLAFDDRGMSPEAAASFVGSLISSPFRDSFVRTLPAMVVAASHPVPAVFIDAWVQECIRTGIGNATALLPVLRTMKDLPQLLRDAGYPIQAERWEDALTRIRMVLSPILSPDDAAALSQALSSNPIVSHDEQPPVVSSSSSSPARRLSEQETLALAKQMLVHNGALIGSQTRLLPQEGPPQTVRITGILLSEQGRDVPYEFTFDPSAQLLSEIVRDGEVLPNAVLVVKFFVR